MAYPVLEAAECKGPDRRGDIDHQNQNHSVSRIEMHNLLRVYCRQRNDGLYPCLIKDAERQENATSHETHGRDEAYAKSRASYLTSRAAPRKDAVEV